MHHRPLLEIQHRSIDRKFRVGMNFSNPSGMHHTNRSPFASLVWKRLVSSVLTIAILSYSLTLAGCSAVGAGLGHLADLDAAERAPVKRYDVTLSSGRRITSVSLSPSFDPSKTALHRTNRPADDTTISNSDLASKKIHQESTRMQTALAVGMVVDLFVLVGISYYEFRVGMAKAEAKAVGAGLDDHCSDPRSYCH